MDNLPVRESPSGTSNVNLLSSVAHGIWLRVATANGATKMHRIAVSAMASSLTQALVYHVLLAGLDALHQVNAVLEEFVLLMQLAGSIVMSL